MIINIVIVSTIFIAVIITSLLLTVLLTTNSLLIWSFMAYVAGIVSNDTDKECPFFCMLFFLLKTSVESYLYSNKESKDESIRKDLMVMFVQA